MGLGVGSAGGAQPGAGAELWLLLSLSCFSQDGSQIALPNSLEQGVDVFGAVC